MAKKTGHRKRRMRGSYVRGNINEQLDLGTLAAKDLIKADFDEVAVEKTFVSSIVATYIIVEFTEAVGDGPISVGIAHSDYTDSEIEGFIEATGSWDPGDKIQQEIGKRLIRRIGMFNPRTDALLGTSRLNDGEPIKTKLNWTLTTGKTLSLWAYNHGTSALATTDPEVIMEGHANLWV